MTNSPSWWHDADQLYTVLTDLMRHLRRRASTFDERTEQWLHLSGMHINDGPWRYVQQLDVVGDVPFETGLVLVNEMLARLQELTWNPDGRDAIDNAHQRIGQIFDPDGIDVRTARDRLLDDDE
jgi:hypothetical protein